MWVLYVGIVGVGGVGIVGGGFGWLLDWGRYTNIYTPKIKIILIIFPYFTLLPFTFLSFRQYFLVRRRFGVLEGRSEDRRQVLSSGKQFTRQTGCWQR